MIGLWYLPNGPPLDIERRGTPYETFDLKFISRKLEVFLQAERSTHTEAHIQESKQTSSASKTVVRGEHASRQAGKQVIHVLAYISVVIDFYSFFNPIGFLLITN